MVKILKKNDKKSVLKNQFYISIFSIFFIQILIKIVGMIYNLFLTNNENYSDEGNGIFMSAHQIYILFLTISIVGIPTSITKLISGKSKNGVDVQKILQISLMVWGVIGTFEMFFVFALSNKIANIFMGNIENVSILKLLAIGIPFVNFNSVYRGALNGIEKTSEGTIIQFIEQIIKVVFPIIGLYWLRNLNIETQKNILYIVTFGVTSSVIITFFIYMNKWKKYKNNIIEESNIRYIDIIKNMFLLSIPVTIIGIFGIINKNIDSISLRYILKDVLSLEKINEIYGMIVSKVDVLINLPIGLNGAITIPLLPKISKMYSNNDYIGIRNIISSSIFISMGFAIPITAGYILFSKDILNLLYPNANSGSDLLMMSSILIILNMLLQIIMVYYNAIGNTNIIIRSFGFGAIIKLILNVFLIRIPNICEKGIIISSIVSDIFIIYILMKNKIFKNIDLKLNDIKLDMIFFETLFMFFIIIIVKNIGEFFYINDKILFVFCLRNRNISVFLQIFYEKI